MSHFERSEQSQSKFNTLDFNKSLSPDEAISQIARSISASPDMLSEYMPKLRDHKSNVIIIRRQLSGGGESLTISPSGISWSYTILDDGEILETSTKSVRPKSHPEQNESPQYKEYFEVNSIEQGLYMILSDVANGKLQSADLRRMSEMYLNNFPPVEYFYLHFDEFTAESCKKMLEGVDSPEAFKATEIYKKITTDPSVIERFKKAASAGGDFRSFWPEEYKVIRILTPSDAISELSKLTGKDAEQLAVEMPKVKEQKGNVQLHKFRTESGQRDCIAVLPAGIKGKEEPAWEYFIYYVYLDNGEVGEYIRKAERVRGWRKTLKSIFKLPFKLLKP